ncbi:hypothetical protein LTS10_013170 [Elasticomyces elasticus]|nr:hypothetical protein LTS10_013170 [Elasticomyces elasticus]
MPPTQPMASSSAISARALSNPTRHGKPISTQPRIHCASGSASRGPSKKRKALDSLPDASDERKRAKPDENEGRREVLAELPPGMEHESEKLAGLAAMARGKNAPAPVATPGVAQEFGLPQTEDQLLDRAYDDGGSTAQKASGDNDELAAFERELAELEERNRVAAFNAEATISAAPMTADEIAAQAREEQSAQRGGRDVEIEDERDEAASALAGEFDEMDGLEARLKRLRERREALRDAKRTLMIVESETMEPWRLMLRPHSRYK